MSNVWNTSENESKMKKAFASVIAGIMAVSATGALAKPLMVMPETKGVSLEKIQEKFGIINNKERGQSMRVTAKFLSLAALLADSSVLANDKIRVTVSEAGK